MKKQIQKVKTIGKAPPPSKNNPAENLSPAEKRLQELADTVGDFIRYWGFRRIHGQIWSQVFISSKSLSGVELTRRLGVSKALISPALQELQDYGLITALEDGRKTKRYQAVPEVVPVIQKILKSRESKLISESKRKFDKVLSYQDSDLNQKALVDEARLSELGEMIQLAQFALKFILSQSDEDSLRAWNDEATRAQG